MADEVVAANFNPSQSTMFTNMITAANTYEMDYLAFFGANLVVDASPSDSPEEQALREILKETRAQLPGIKLGVVVGDDDNFSDFETSDIQFSPTPWEACEPEPGISALSSNDLMNLMNPQNPSQGQRYRAEVLKFVARLYKYFNGTYTPGQTQINSNSNLSGTKDDGAKAQAAPYEPPERGDYFDWVSLDHEYWVGEFVSNTYGSSDWQDSDPNDINDAYYDHKLILDGIHSTLSSSALGCYASVESYENIITTNFPVTYNSVTRYISTSINTQADELTGKMDRVLPNYYFWFPEGIDDRHCKAIEAWGQSTWALSTDFWPAFSVERSDESKSYCVNSSGQSWGDFLGWFMDPSTPCNTPLPYDPCQDPKAPYDVDEVEDVFLNEVNQATWSCDSNPASIGNYQPDGFMWFTLHLMDNQGVVKKTGTVDHESVPLEVFPNPVSANLNLPSDTKLVNVFSATGQLMPMEIEGNQLSVEDYPEGLYILTFEGEAKTLTIKVQH